MAIYRYRCDDCGDFLVHSLMRDTTPTAACEHCGVVAPKVLSGRLQFTYGRDAFANGPEGKGLTVRETAEQWRNQYKAETGRDAIPVGSRWV